LVTSDVFFGEIVQETAALGHHSNQSAPGMNVLFVDTQMAGNLMDSRGEYRNL
jgi:hypothetical protein